MKFDTGGAKMRHVQDGIRKTSTSSNRSYSTCEQPRPLRTQNINTQTLRPHSCTVSAMTAAPTLFRKAATLTNVPNVRTRPEVHTVETC